MANEKSNKQASKSAAAKKVARAAQSGSGGSGSERRVRGFPLLVTLIIVLGVVGVVAAWASRDAATPPAQGEDHWHAAYGVWDCAAGESGEFVAPFMSTDDPLGIHSHQDGLMHIHPFAEASAGNNAQLKIFLGAMGAEVSEDAIVLPGGAELEAGVECEGEAAIIQVVRWPFASAVDEDPQVYTGTDEMNDISYKNDAEAWVIARAPEGADIPPPETIVNLISVTDAITQEDLDEDGDGEIDEQYRDSPSTSTTPEATTGSSSEGTDSSDDGS